MKTEQITTKLIVVSLVGAAVLLLSLSSGEGGLEPTAPPGATMHTLEDIYSAVTSLGASTPQSTAYDMFLKIDGIDGESYDDAKHKDWIDVLAYSHGVNQPTSALPGSPIGKCEHQDFSVTKWMDKSSPLLALYCCNGDHITQVTLELCEGTGEKRKLMHYELEDVIISSFKPRGGTVSGEGRPQEDISFNYRKIEWNYTFYSLDGKGSDVMTSWDVAANKSD